MFIRQHLNGWELLDGSRKQFGFNSEGLSVLVKRYQVFELIPCVDTDLQTRIWFCVQ